MAKNGNIHPSRIFKTPDELLSAWEGYKTWLEEEAEKWKKVQYVGKDGDRVTDNYKLPLIMDGFELYCHKNHGCVHHYFDNKEGYYDDFGVICRAIKTEIKNDQLTGGLLNVYNPSITQRLNGLTDKSQVEHSGSIETITGMRITDGDKP